MNDQCLHGSIALLMLFTSYRKFDLSVVADCCHGESIGSSGLQSPRAGPVEDGGEQINVLIMSEAADSISLPSESLLVQCDSKRPCAHSQSNRTIPAYFTGCADNRGGNLFLLR